MWSFLWRRSRPRADQRARSHSLPTPNGPPPPKIAASLPVQICTAADESLRCEVCLENYRRGERTRRLPCLHRFHAKCIDEWLHNATTCPQCRHDIHDTQLPPEALVVSEVHLEPARQIDVKHDPQNERARVALQNWSHARQRARAQAEEAARTQAYAQHRAYQEQDFARARSRATAASSMHASSAQDVRRRQIEMWRREQAGGRGPRQQAPQPARRKPERAPSAIRSQSAQDFETDPSERRPARFPRGASLVAIAEPGSGSLLLVGADRVVRYR